MRKAGFKKKKSGIDIRGLLIAILITAFIIFMARGGFAVLAKVLMEFKTKPPAAVPFLLCF